MIENVGGVSYEVALDTRKMLDAERTAARSLQRIGDEGAKLQTRMTAIASAIGAALGAIALEGLISKVVNAQRSFDVMFASLKTVTGGLTQATAAWERLQRFASTTPFSLQQSVDGFVKLKALGLDPSERAMTSFGNTSSAMGRSLTQMIEAVADASTGEFERLKEFGIKAKQQGDKVSLTFQGVTTTIGNNSAEIVEYLTRIGEVEFAGAMSERMKTLDGDISNLEDSLQGLYLSISQSGVGDAIAAGVRKATEAIQELSTSVKEGGLTEYFDDLRPLITAAEVAAVSLAGAVAGRLVSAFVAAAAQAAATAAGIGAATLAARGFSAVLAALGGPIGIAITGLALLALNWDKVAGSAQDAATISEQAAARIAGALKKAPSRATKDLAEQMAEAKKQLATLDTEIKAGSVRSIYGDRGPVYGSERLAELREQRDAVVKAIGDIQKAMDSLHGGAGRGKDNPDDVTPRAMNADAPAPSPAPMPPGAARFDAAGYLAGLERASLEGVERIDAIEREALRKNAELLKEKKITVEQAARAVTMIERDAAEERHRIQLRAAEDNRQSIEDAGKDAADAATRFAEEQRRASNFAADIVAQGDPAAQVTQFYERRADALAEARARELLTEQAYAAAVVANAEQMRAALDDITQRRVLAEQAAQATLMMSAAGFLDATAELHRAAAGEQSGMFRALFAASKAFAVANATLNLYAAAVQAMADPTALTPMQKFANYAAVLTAGANLMGQIKGASFGGGRQYGGPVAAGTMYRVNESGRPEMFTAANGAQYMLPTANGQVTSADQVSRQAAGGRSIHVTNHFHLSGPTDQRSQQQIASAAARGLQAAAARNN